MKTWVKEACIAVSLLLYAGGINAAGTLHKYWTCTVSSYSVFEASKRLEHQCLANTEYSEPPCRPFVVEYEGAEGVRPDKPYQQNIKMVSGQPATVRIAISKEGPKFAYAHSIEPSGADAAQKWHYSGVCQYNEAPGQEKIYMDFGLKTGR